MGNGNLLLPQERVGWAIVTRSPWKRSGAVERHGYKWDRGHEEDTRCERLDVGWLVYTGGFRFGDEETGGQAWLAWPFSAMMVGLTEDSIVVYVYHYIVQVPTD